MQLGEAWARPLDATWYVQSTERAETIERRLRPVADAADGLLIQEVEANALLFNTALRWFKRRGNHDSDLAHTEATRPVALAGWTRCPNSAWFRSCGVRSPRACAPLRTTVACLSDPLASPPDACKTVACICWWSLIRRRYRKTVSRYCRLPDAGGRETMRRQRSAGLVIALVVGGAIGSRPDLQACSISSDLGPYKKGSSKAILRSSSSTSGDGYPAELICSQTLRVHR